MKCDNPESLMPDIHIGNEIARYMSRERYSPSWLAKKLYCDRTNVYKILRKSSIDVALLMRISVALRHDFFTSIPARWNISCRKMKKIAKLTLRNLRKSFNISYIRVYM